MKTKLKMTLAAALLLSSVSAFADNANMVQFPEMKDSHVKGGAFIDGSHLGWMRTGLNKKQITLQLGIPHFGAGIVSDTWDYAFNLTTGNGNEYMTCQYQVHFKDGAVDAMRWRDNRCEAYVK